MQPRHSPWVLLWAAPELKEAGWCRSPRESSERGAAGGDARSRWGSRKTGDERGRDYYSLGVEGRKLPFLTRLRHLPQNEQCPKHTNKEEQLISNFINNY